MGQAGRGGEEGAARGVARRGGPAEVGIEGGAEEEGECQEESESRRR